MSPRPRTLIILAGAFLCLAGLTVSALIVSFVSLSRASRVAVSTQIAATRTAEVARRFQMQATIASELRTQTALPPGMATPIPVQATMNAVRETLLTETAVASGSVRQPGSEGTIQGKTCYPSGGTTEMLVYVQERHGSYRLRLRISAGQETYAVSVPPGTYVAYVWLADGADGASYSQAVVCGGQAACTDHSLIEFEVRPGEVTSGIDVCDWEGEMGDIPAPPP